MLRAGKGLALVLALAMLPVPMAYSQTAKRLILKDGTFQMATEWKKAGERVKYFSAERGEWEEVPVALVDWKATEEWNAEQAKTVVKQEEELHQASEEEVAKRKEEMLNTPLVAPDMRLPAEGGVFLFEEVAGKPVLSKVETNKIQVNDNAGKNLLKRSIIPIAAQVQTIELKGATAKVRVHTKEPGIFVDVENDKGVIPATSFRIVRLERKKDLRVVAKNKVNLGGEQNVTETFLKSRAEKFSGEWWKVVPLEDLKPGEYALVISDAGDDGNGAVWDFGVD